MSVESPIELETVRQTIGRVTRHDRVGEGLFELWWHAPELIAAQPGQFVHVSCREGYLRRPFSVYRTAGSEVAILYQVKGAGTRELSRCVPGDELDVLGPIGRPFQPPAPGERLLLVAGGVGVAPLALYAQRYPALQGQALLGFRSDAFISGLAPFHEAGLAVTLLTEDGSTGRRGRVTDGLTERICAEGITRILTCGPDAMMRAVAAIAEEYGVACEASVERPMGCGIGICLACVVPVHAPDGRLRYDRACQEGPVFDAREVAW